MFERFTTEAKAVVVEAQEQCRRLGGRAIGPEHLLLAIWVADGTAAVRALEGPGLLRDDLRRDVADFAPLSDAAALRTLGIDLDGVRQRVEAAFGPGALERTRRSGTKPCGRSIPFTPSGKRALELSLRASLELGHRSIGSEHVLLGIVAAGDRPVERLLTGHGVDPLSLRRAVLAEL
jgi:ATP-dependent Clp protease ATP-binding subunit ClpA